MDSVKPHVVQSLDLDGLMSLADDLIKVLDTPRDISELSEVHEELSRLKSVVKKDWSEVQMILKGIQEKVLMYKQNIETVEKEGVDDEKLQALRFELEIQQQYQHQLSQELRVIEDEMDRLELQRVYIENRKEAVSKAKKEEIRAQNELSLYASVTTIIPDLNEMEKYMGYIVDREKRMVKKFEIDQTEMSEIEICNRLWEACDS